ncbi:MAG TPA: hypothetical protein VF189_01195 [Patescibacteria group bacterium]
MIEEEKTRPIQVTDADWAFAARHEITNESLITRRLIVIRGIPKSYPRRISVIEKSPKIEQTIARYDLTVGQTLKGVSDVLSDAIDSIRVARKNYK